MLGFSTPRGNEAIAVKVRVTNTHSGKSIIVKVLVNGGVGVMNLSPCQALGRSWGRGWG